MVGNGGCGSLLGSADWRGWVAVGGFGFCGWLLGSGYWLGGFVLFPFLSSLSHA